MAPTPTAKAAKTLTARPTAASSSPSGMLSRATLRSALVVCAALLASSALLSRPAAAVFLADYIDNMVPESLADMFSRGSSRHPEALVALPLSTPSRPADPADGGADGSGPAAMRVRGTVHGRHREFLGVPFAESPTGDLRWRAPVPSKGWRGTRDATRFGDMCLQPNLGGGLGLRMVMRSRAPGKSEDCLSLNIWTPRVEKIPEGGVPVIFFLYGGSFYYGDGSVVLYDGSDLLAHAPSSEPVIVVTSNYRLGSLGFLASSQLAHEADGVAGNYGLLDQRMALQWVSENIAAFGGDPKRITMLGHSAGAIAASMHLILPESNKYIHAAYLMSGSPGSTQPTPVTEVQGLYDRLVDKSGCKEATAANGAAAPVLMDNGGEGVPGDSAAHADESRVLECLRSIPGEKILELAGSYSPDADLTAWFPVIDGHTIPKSSWALAQEFAASPSTASGSPRRVVIGTTADEGSLFAPEPVPEDPIAYLAAQLNSTADARAVWQLYDPERYFDKDAFTALSSIMGDAVFLCPVRRYSSLFSSSEYLRVWSYEFDRAAAPMATRFLLGSAVGAAHGIDVPMMFGSMAGIMGPYERTTSRALVSALTAVAYGRDVDTTIPTWVPLVRDPGAEKRILRITGGEHLGEMERMWSPKADGVQRDRCDFWATRESAREHLAEEALRHVFEVRKLKAARKQRGGHGGHGWFS